jgi:cysteine desulfuration protein SufE
MTLDEAQRQVIAEFSRLEDGFDRYEHLIALGKKHKSLDDRFKTGEFAMPGCQSQVWIRSELRDGQLHFHADSDSQIIRGILVLLLVVLSGRAPADVENADLYFLREVGLSSHLSPRRANGVATIVRHMQQRAADLNSCSGSTGGA